MNLGIDGLSAGQLTSVWQVLVARLGVIVVLNRSTAFRHTVVLPNLLVPTPNAEDIYKAIWYHPDFLAVMCAIRMLLHLSAEGIEVHETDGAYACERLWAYIVEKTETLPPSTPPSYAGCMRTSWRRCSWCQSPTRRCCPGSAA